MKQRRQERKMDEGKCTTHNNKGLNAMQRSGVAF